MNQISHKPTGFQKPSSNRMMIRVIFGTFVLTIAILAILPFTQVLTKGMAREELTQIDTTSIPPPELPPEPPEPPPEEEEEEPPPELDSEPPPLDLSALDAALNPGIGDAVGQAFNFDAFGVQPDIEAEMQIFSVADLDNRPRPVRFSEPVWPRRYQLEGLRGRFLVTIIIDEQGNVVVEDVPEFFDREGIQAVRQSVARWTFDVPMKDGQAVRARYNLPITFNFQ